MLIKSPNSALACSSRSPQAKKSSRAKETSGTTYSRLQYSRLQRDFNNSSLWSSNSSSNTILQILRSQGIYLLYSKAPAVMEQILSTLATP